MNISPIIYFAHEIKTAQKEVHKLAVEKGWWDTPRDSLHLIALMHSELSEAVEYIRHGNPKSDHIPNFSGVEEELADCIVRILDFAEKEKFDLAGAFLAKMEFNATRPYRHGGKLA